MTRRRRRGAGRARAARRRRRGGSSPRARPPRPPPAAAARRLNPAPGPPRPPRPLPERRTAASLSAPATAGEPSASRPARPPSRPQNLMRTGMGGRGEGSPQRPGPRGFSSFRLVARFLKVFPELASHTGELYSVLTTAC